MDGATVTSSKIPDVTVIADLKNPTLHSNYKIVLSSSKKSIMHTIFYHRDDRHLKVQIQEIESKC
jgi:hypothetical protein